MQQLIKYIAAYIPRYMRVAYIVTVGVNVPAFHPSLESRDMVFGVRMCYTYIFKRYHTLINDNSCNSVGDYNIVNAQVMRKIEKK